ncbi:MAG TPA: divalent-cation tolerance protein CutA [Desulfobulbus sp.]|nr:divalent-cation tolerance protein CutA [Desulfobulbus sp.]
MGDFIQVVTTIDSRDNGCILAGKLLDLRLVACVQILACDSMYHWQDKIDNSREYLCLMKTRADLFPALEKAIADFHPYEVPEILATPVTAGNASYLEWLEQELQPVDKEKG